MANSCECGCSCGQPTVLIYACSGAANTGEISDLAARKLTKEGVGKMFCLAGLGGKVDLIIKQAEAADVNIVIDGCSLDCAAKSFENVGITDFIHLRVTDLGIEKNKSEVNDENVDIVVNHVKKILA